MISLMSPFLNAFKRRCRMRMGFCMYKDFSLSCLCVVTSSSFVPDMRLLDTTVLLPIGESPARIPWSEPTSVRPGIARRLPRYGNLQAAAYPKNGCRRYESVSAICHRCPLGLLRILGRIVGSSLGPQLAVATVHQGSAPIAKASPFIPAVFLI